MSAKELILKEAYMKYREEAGKNKPVELIAVVDKDTKAIQLLANYNREEK